MRTNLFILLAFFCQLALASSPKVGEVEGVNHIDPGCKCNKTRPHTHQSENRTGKDNGNVNSNTQSQTKPSRAVRR